MLATIGAIVLMMIMAYAQNLSFTLVSRSRNRSSFKYHIAASVLSNFTWFITAKYLIVTHGMTWTLMLPYTVATVAGSVTGQKVSMWIEKKIGAVSDA